MSLGKSLSSAFIDQATSKMPPTPISGKETGDELSRQPKQTGDDMAGKHHPYSHHVTHHFKDGSGHTHIHHESDPKKDVEFAHLNHDQMMDGLQQHLGGAGSESPGEEAMEAGAGGAPAPQGAM